MGIAKDEFSIDLRSYLKLLSRRRWILIATFVTVVLATGLVTWRLTPIYEGEALVEVQPTSSSSSSEASRTLEALVDPTRGLQTQVTLAQSEGVLSRAAKALDILTTDELRDALSVELLPDTQILAIRIQHERPDEARDWANAMADAYLSFRRESAEENSTLQREDITGDIEEIQQRIRQIDVQSEQDPAAAVRLRAERDRALTQLTVLETELNELPDPDRVQRGGGRIVTAAVAPTEPVRPRKALNMALAVVIGSLLGLGLVFVAENLDDRLKNPEEVEERVGAPVLGYIPLVKEWNDSGRSKIAILSATASGAAEAYRTLRANLRFVSLEKPFRTILVTSPVASAGKSTTSANLAATLAQGGSKVVLVSGDLRRPSVHKLFGLSNARGVVDILDPDFPLSEGFQKPEIPNLRLLATGGLPPNPTEILGSERFGQILSQLREIADYVILDAPPVLGLGDSSALASKVDGVLLVVRTGSVTKREVTHAVDQLRKAGGKIAGAVLNAVEAEDGYGYYYHYYYTQYQDNSNGNGSPNKAVPARSTRKGEAAGDAGNLSASATKPDPLAGPDSEARIQRPDR